MHQSGCPVEKACTQQVEADEAHQRRAYQAQPGEALAALMHRFGLERCIAILFRQVGIERLGRCVQQIAPEASDWPVREDVLVYGIIGPARVPAVEQAKRPVGIPFAMTEPSAKKTIAPGHFESGMARLAQCRADGSRELGRKLLVGIQAQHPVVRGLRHGIAPLRSEPEPTLLDHARTAGASNFYGIILAAGIDDHDFRGKAHGIEASGELCTGIARDHHEAQFRQGQARLGSDNASGVGLESVFRCEMRSAAHSTCNAPPSHPPDRQHEHAVGIHCRDPRQAHPMSRALIIRPSSLGDIVHAVPVVHDIRRHCPDIAVDWVAEEAFAALVAMQRDVDRVIPVALRRWRHSILERSTWREAAAFRRALTRDRYDVVLDLQEQVKGALLAWLARGPVHGPDRNSIREPVASFTYRHRYTIDPGQHLIDRCRQLAGAAFGYVPEGAPHFGLVPPPLLAAPETPYAVFVHATSRSDKLWPEPHWRTLIAHFTQAGLAVLLPWGTSEEAERSARLAEGLPGSAVCPRRELPDLAALLAGAEVVCGVDTGLVHLAAALGAPTVALFVATDPRLAGVARAGPRCRDLGGAGIVPAPAEVIAAVGALLRSLPAC